MPKKKRTFRMEIEATVEVEAFDVPSAQKKVNATFASRRKLGQDVSALGIAYVYDTRQEGDPAP